MAGEAEFPLEDTEKRQLEPHPTLFVYSRTHRRSQLVSSDSLTGETHGTTTNRFIRSYTPAT